LDNLNLFVQIIDYMYCNWYLWIDCKFYYFSAFTAC